MYTSKLFFVPLAAAFLLLFSGPLFAQSAGPGASEIDVLLESREVSFSQAVSFVQEASESSVVQAVSPDRPITMGELSFIVMKSFNIKGSFLYALFPGPRYGYRDMNYLRFLPEPSDPSMKVSGIQLLQIVERVLNYLEPAERAESAAAAREAQQAAEAAQEAERAAQAAAAAAAQAAEREQMMKEIQAQLTEQAVANTTVRLVDDGVAISMSDIQFSGDSAVLVEAERIKIMKIAVMLQRYPGRPILVGGHTAMAGTAKGRQEISTDRAQSVADFLVYLGCRTEAEITVRGYGADRPVADNATAAGQALNRRVEITLLDRE